MDSKIGRRCSGGRSTAESSLGRNCYVLPGHCLQSSIEVADDETLGKIGRDPNYPLHGRQQYRVGERFCPLSDRCRGRYRAVVA